MIYLDNAATSFPKPEETIEHLTRFVTTVGGNPGRSGHKLSVEAARIIFEAREKLAEFIHGKRSERLIFTANGTESLNLAILGLLGENDHVITTSLEHNSVMRPLMHLKERRGVEYTVIQCGPDGCLDIEALARAMRKNTKAVIINHGSNVIGTTQPLREIKQAIGNVTLITDACQTIGSVPIDIDRDNIDVLCFSCHKSLLGIQGLGAIYIREGINPRPLKLGGTGSRSESIEHPDFLPDRYECGTPNTPAIASLLGGLTFIEKQGLGRIAARKNALREKLVQGLSGIEHAIVYGCRTNETNAPVISFNLKNKLPSEVGYELNQREIYVRVGLTCAPMAHKTIGTFPAGTVRVSPGYFTTDAEIDHFLEELQHIAER
ncbi:aminotransferase class V-fold PLP-dependent enzyme [Syntrophorhabdus aromaticivorans]|uniref:aminotransferase class V-fold PLP-dependent enzyme n=1 Tax=Syntrophorhabdus aromaticivorans TaxID=328301 RepID=UPI00040F7265|nr:aminotransferase class V-fold PLP-dependent enzyme [Syntrophorhabdus aromaticivorans]